MSSCTRTRHTSFVGVGGGGGGDWGKLKLNEPTTAELITRQKRQDSWQRAKHEKFYSDLPCTLKKKEKRTSHASEFLAEAETNFCVRGNLTAARWGERQHFELSKAWRPLLTKLIDPYHPLSASPPAPPSPIQRTHAHIHTTTTTTTTFFLPCFYCQYKVG